MAREAGRPSQAVWMISLVLYVVALLATFHVVSVPADAGRWSWILGYGLLLVACRMRGL
jgi:hypothetical protein